MLIKDQTARSMQSDPDLHSLPNFILSRFASQPISKPPILDSPILKEFAANIFKSDWNSRKFSGRMENAVGKGEIARYEQFLLFPQCFQKTCTADR